MFKGDSVDDANELQEIQVLILIKYYILQEFKLSVL